MDHLHSRIIMLRNKEYKIILIRSCSFLSQVIRITPLEGEISDVTNKIYDYLETRGWRNIFICEYLSTSHSNSHVSIERKIFALWRWQNNSRRAKINMPEEEVVITNHIKPQISTLGQQLYTSPRPIFKPYLSSDHTYSPSVGSVELLLKANCPNECWHWRKTKNIQICASQLLFEQEMPQSHYT